MENKLGVRLEWDCTQCYYSIILRASSIFLLVTTNKIKKVKIKIIILILQYIRQSYINQCHRFVIISISYQIINIIAHH